MHRIACLLLALAACSDDDGSGPVGGTPDETIMDEKVLASGEIVEAIFTAGAGDRVELVLSAPVAKLDWNIHGHANGSTQNVVEGYGVMNATYNFSPSAEADWYLLIRNQDTAPMTVSINADLFGAVEWHGFEEH